VTGSGLGVPGNDNTEQGVLVKDGKK